MVKIYNCCKRKLEIIDDVFLIREDKCSDGCKNFIIVNNFKICTKCPHIDIDYASVEPVKIIANDNFNGKKVLEKEGFGQILYSELYDTKTNAPLNVFSYSFFETKHPLNLPYLPISDTYFDYDRLFYEKSRIFDIYTKKVFKFELLYILTKEAIRCVEKVTSFSVHITYNSSTKKIYKKELKVRKRHAQLAFVISENKFFFIIYPYAISLTEVNEEFKDEFDIFKIYDKNNKETERVYIW